MCVICHNEGIKNNRWVSKGKMKGVSPATMVVALRFVLKIWAQVSGFLALESKGWKDGLTQICKRSTVT